MSEFKVYNDFTAGALQDWGPYPSQNLLEFQSYFQSLTIRPCHNLDDLLVLCDDIENAKGVYLVPMSLSHLRTLPIHPRCFVILQSVVESPQDLVSIRQAGLDGIVLDHIDAVELQYFIEVCREVNLEPIPYSSAGSSCDSRWFLLKKNDLEICANPLHTP